MSGDGFSPTRWDGHGLVHDVRGREATPVVDHRPIPVADPMFAFSFGPTVYEGRKDGTPFTLVDCWRETEGVADARIWRIRPDGSLSLVLNEAGSRYRHISTLRQRFHKV